MSDDGVQSDLGEDLSLVLPYLTPCLLRDYIGQTLMGSTDELSHAELDDFRGPVRQMPRQPPLERVGGLHDVVIDRDDRVDHLARFWIAEKILRFAFNNC